MSKIASWEEAGNRHIDLREEFRPRPFHRQIARLAAKYSVDGSTVLDLGCGLGQIGYLIKQQRPGCKLFVADAYQQCLDTTLEHVEVEGAYLQSEEGLDLEGIRHDGRLFDVVVMSHVLEHMLDPVGAVRELMTIVKPGGHCILAVPNPARPQVLLTNLFRIHYVNRGHVVAWDRSHWQNFLEGILGLDVVEYAYDSVVLLPTRLRYALPFWERIEIALARLAPWWSFSNIAVIENGRDAESGSE